MHTSTLLGIDALPVEVEVDVGTGLPGFAIVGLPDAAVQEARERVRAAIRANGFDFPNARVVVNLAPGPLRKHGTGFDLPIALALLIATRQLPVHVLDDCSTVGELSLDGAVRRVPGLLAHARAARDRGLAFVGPPDSPLGLLEDLEYRLLPHLGRLKEGFPGAESFPRPASVELPNHEDIRDVVGQPLAKRALEIAAAGAHNFLMVGPPGSGKTMLARRLPGILPCLTDEERLGTALVHSVAGLDEERILAGRRPFRSPHHSCSIAGLVGGGSPPNPGEVSLAHNGVLFLDELPEFGPARLQTLRQPLEDGFVILVRADGRVRYPARFTLVGAANPCPCGFLGDPVKPCRCTPAIIARYQSRIGGPLMDRIDLYVRVDRPETARLLEGEEGEASSDVRTRVLAAREFARERGHPRASTLSGTSLLTACRLDGRARTLLESLASGSRLSGRAVTRVLRVARTIADLESRTDVGFEHIAEAAGFRFDAGGECYDTTPGLVGPRTRG